MFSSNLLRLLHSQIHGHPTHTHTQKLKIKIDLFLKSVFVNPYLYWNVIQVKRGITSIGFSINKAGKDKATLKRTGWELTTIKNKGSFEDIEISKAKQVANVIELCTQNGKCYSMYTVPK